MEIQGVLSAISHHKTAKAPSAIGAFALPITFIILFMVQSTDMAYQNFIFQADSVHHLCFLIAYSETEIYEDDLFFDGTRVVSVIFDLSKNNPPTTISHIYSDELTEDSCRATLTRLQAGDTTLLPAYYRDYMSQEESAEYLKQHATRYETVLKNVQFLPLSACPETKYIRRIRTLFSDIITRIAKNPYATRTSTFHGSRQLYDNAIISFLQSPTAD